MTLRRVPSALPRPYAPHSGSFTRRFWEALAEGRFEITRCRACGFRQFPPRPHCPQCHQTDMYWVAVTGAGRLYARTRIHAAGGPFAAMTPYSVGLVDLDEGIRLLTRLLHDASSLDAGSAVRLVVVDHSDGPLFAATSASSLGLAPSGPRRFGAMNQSKQGKRSSTG